MLVLHYMKSIFLDEMWCGRLYLDDRTSRQWPGMFLVLILEVAEEIPHPFPFHHELSVGCRSRWDLLVVAGGLQGESCY